jgi:hypothetical protein
MKNASSGILYCVPWYQALLLNIQQENSIPQFSYILWFIINLYLLNLLQI